jgi:hypothetical protein
MAICSESSSWTIKFLTFDLDGLSPANKFYGNEVPLDLKEFHTFGCPAFVLDARLQSGSIGPRQSEIEDLA